MNLMNSNVKWWFKSIRKTHSSDILITLESRLKTPTNICIWWLLLLVISSFNSLEHMTLINCLKSTIETRVEWIHKRLNFPRVKRIHFAIYTTSLRDILVVSYGPMANCCRSINSSSTMMRVYWIIRWCWNMGRGIRSMTNRLRKCQLEYVLLTYTTTFYMKIVSPSFH